MISAQGGVYMGTTHDGMESTDLKNDQNQQQHRVVNVAKMATKKSVNIEDCGVYLGPTQYDSKDRIDLKKRQELKHHIEKAAELVAEVVNVENVTEMDGKIANYGGVYCGPTHNRKDNLNSKNYLGNLVPIMILVTDRAPELPTLLWKWHEEMGFLDKFSSFFVKFLVAI